MDERAEELFEAESHLAPSTPHELKLSGPRVIPAAPLELPLQPHGVIERPHEHHHRRRLSRRARMALSLLMVAGVIGIVSMAWIHRPPGRDAQAAQAAAGFVPPPLPPASAATTTAAPPDTRPAPPPTPLPVVTTPTTKVATATKKAATPKKDAKLAPPQRTPAGRSAAVKPPVRSTPPPGRSVSPRPATVSTPGTAPTQPPAVSSPATATAAPPATTPPPVAPRSEPPATATPPASTPASPAPVEQPLVKETKETKDNVSAADRRGVETIVGRYRDAFTNLDASAVRAVWPSANEKQLARAFGQLQDQRLEFHACDFDIKDAVAAATCTGVAVYVPKVGNKNPRFDDRRWVFTLKRAQGGWVIQDVVIR